MILKTLFHEQVDYDEHFVMKLAGVSRPAVKHWCINTYFFLTPKLGYFKTTHSEVTEIEGVFM